MAMELEVRKKIVHKYFENPSWSQKQISKSPNVPKSTVGDVLKRYKETLSVERAKQSGTKKGPRNKKLHATIVRSFKQNPGLSDRDRAKRYGASSKMIYKTRLRSGKQSYNVIKRPNRNDKQNLMSKTRARKLYDTVLTKFKGCIVMDDETYVKVYTNQIPGRKFYVAEKRLGVANKYKFVNVDKYGKKLLVWQAICSCGRKNKAFVTSSTFNSNLYITECLQRFLLPFIKEHKSKVIFWP